MSKDAATLHTGGDRGELATLAATVRRAHEQVIIAACDALDHAMRAGEALGGDVRLAASLLTGRHQ
jgi:hypothetical protein